MRVSVCLASYNGAPFIARQLASILSELRSEDEVIIVDDSSSDSTVEVAQQVGDPRVSIYVNGENRGEVYSFNRAMSLAKGDVLFLSDQDDIWIPGRVGLMTRRLLESGADVVSSNFDWMDTNENPIDIEYDGVEARHGSRHLRNIVDIFVGRTNYFGCAMAFRRSFLPVISPIPSFVESHDLWIALASNLARSNVHLDDRTLRKRKHAANATSTKSNRPVWRRLRSRWVFGRSLVELRGRLRGRRA